MRKVTNQMMRVNNISSKLNPKHHQLIREILERIFESNIRPVSILVEGSFCNQDEIENVSDMDLLILVDQMPRRFQLRFDDLSEKYHYDIKCGIKKYDDFRNRARNSKRANRFFSNLYLMILKHRSLVLWGKNIKKEIPSDHILQSRDITSDLRAEYLFATNIDPTWNIHKARPIDWPGFIINMASKVLWAQGIFVKKNQVLTVLEQTEPLFKVGPIVTRAIRMRNKRVLHTFTTRQIKKLRTDLKYFLNAYQSYFFKK